MAHIYEDETVLLTESNLIIRNFQFPSKKSKTISVEQINIVWFEEQSCCKCPAVKTWGKSNLGIYWALDVKRCLPHASRWNVVVDCGAKLKLGFTVDDGAEFMEAMRNVLDYHVIIVDSINLG